MVLTMDNTREDDRTVLKPVAIQDRLWWERYSRYAFGNTGARPWRWNEATALPTLFWEGGTAADAPARNEAVEIYTVEELQSVGESLSAPAGLGYLFPQ
jgi:hypothetical protein